jgi:prolyl-tRNA editing enzyme YbaK/EbsC (Cys-tRNA(Pro) deacylase)
VRSSIDVHDLLTGLGVAHEMLHLPGHAATAPAAAQLLGVAVAEVVKSLLFLVDGAPVLVLAPGDALVDTVALATLVGGSAAALAGGREVLAVTGYSPGAVPPCALAEDVPVVADPRVFAPPVVYCGGGTTTTMLKIRSADLEALLTPRLAAVTRRA